MDDLAMLSEEVRKAFDEIDECMRMDIKVVPVGALGVLRAELLRLARENAEWRKVAADWRAKAAVFESERDVARSMHGQRDEELQRAIVDRERAESDRDALLKRIDSAPTGIYKSGIADQGTVYTYHFAVQNLIGQRVALLPVGGE